MESFGSNQRDRRDYHDQHNQLNRNEASYSSGFSRGEAIMQHEIDPENRNEHQILLANDLYVSLFGKENLKGLTASERAGTLLSFWVEEKYAKLYARLENDNEFKFHRRLAGDIFRITPEDMVEYKKTGEMPE